MSNNSDNLDFFFNPKTVAIIGASESLKFGYTMTNYLLNSSFKTYPVNINKEKIFGYKAYKRISDIPEQIELAIIIVPNDNVLETVKDCVKSKVKGIIIETAGFAETGIEKYVLMQREIEKIAKITNIRIIGPNCVGITNFTNKFTTTDVEFDKLIEGGSISIIAQSGVLGNVVVDWASSQKIAFAKSITLGNKVDVDEIDMLEYLEKDPYTKVITLYLEGIKKGTQLLETLKKVSKPIILLKNGRSEAGTNAIKSHTGSIAGDFKIFKSLFKQIPGLFQVDNFYEMFDIAQIFSTQPLPRGKNIAIITASGSLGSLACDQIEQNGLKLAQLQHSTIKTMKQYSPNWTSVRNPVDLGPSMFATFKPAITALMNDENVNAILYIFAVPQKPLEQFSLTMIPHFRLVNNLVNQFRKPVIICVFGSRWTFDYILKDSVKYNIPVIERTDHAIKALKMMYDFKKLQ
ncbi:MAG: acetyl-CoA synthetase [Promethearchaeota archaeon]|nr:MAG: acetyl-CoA synthetase [Candidatus Lokiarchaeota archaeon]